MPNDNPTKMMVCKTCKSWDLEYWDNALLCTTFEWGFYCHTCQKYIDPYDDVETVSDESLCPPKSTNVSSVD
jgi:hypothetical protein